MEKTKKIMDIEMKNLAKLLIEDFYQISVVDKLRNFDWKDATKRIGREYILGVALFVGFGLGYVVSEHDLIGKLKSSLIEFYNQLNEEYFDDIQNGNGFSKRMKDFDSFSFRLYQVHFDESKEFLPY